MVREQPNFLLIFRSEMAILDAKLLESITTLWFSGWAYTLRNFRAIFVKTSSSIFKLPLTVRWFVPRKFRTLIFVMTCHRVKWYFFKALSLWCVAKATVQQLFSYVIFTFALTTFHQQSSPKIFRIQRKLFRIQVSLLSSTECLYNTFC